LHFRMAASAEDMCWLLCLEGCVAAPVLQPGAPVLKCCLAFQAFALLLGWRGDNSHIEHFQCASCFLSKAHESSVLLFTSQTRGTLNLKEKSFFLFPIALQGSKVPDIRFKLQLVYFWVSCPFYVEQALFFSSSAETQNVDGTLSEAWLLGQGSKLRCFCPVSHIT
jgi:hypothetical protein